MKLAVCLTAMLICFTVVGCGKTEPRQAVAHVDNNNESPACKKPYPSDSCKLSERFKVREINIEGLAFKDLEEGTTSSSVFENNDYVAAAYYLSKEYVENKYILRVSLYDKQKKNIINTEIDLRKPKEIRGFSVDLNIRENYLYLNLHYNPSAGTTIILNSELKYIADVYGYDAQVFKEKMIIYEKSQVHWASTHYVEIAVLDLKTKKDVIIYPMKPYQKIRQEYINLNNYFINKLGADWVRKADYVSSGELFDNGLRDGIYCNEELNAFVFLTVFERSNRYPPEIKLDNKEVVYIYRNVDNKNIEYRELLLGDVKKKYGDVPLKELLTEKTLKEVFDNK
ncbi:MAG: hypothetical protein A2231_01360 [Candidatus Firestonebacteria bacterium RIFOXYA2_FULL_40_8]|nr:MAG: hypothetical protein A2231_01360 [Candidatus Firestonebacteria bacterium RIFOXYA2_FULL_40_8]